MTAAPAVRPVRPRDAASLVLLRHMAAGPRVLMGRRPARSRFAPDVFVFPGGRVDRADFDQPVAGALAEACVRRMAAEPRLAAALATAALRETTEETGLILPADHAPLTVAARAITPTNSPVRFHARFFLADAELAQGEAADSSELADLAWRPLDEALRLPIYDITEAVLRSLQTSAPPFLMTYRAGTTRVRPLV
ncbi:MAG: NUDIX hydrolase [Caulobacter sp.]|nr:NUDIX hydrolase [Caulobacter sp.]